MCSSALFPSHDNESFAFLLSFSSLSLFSVSIFSADWYCSASFLIFSISAVVKNSTSADSSPYEMTVRAAVIGVAKLLMSLGYVNFDTIIQYDIYAMAEAFFADFGSWDSDDFQDSLFSIEFSSFEASSILNSPNLSILPLLAYHKICNDHYRNEKWQPFEPWTCNIDYLSPTDNMNAKTFISSSTFTSLMTSLIDLENSNPPIVTGKQIGRAHV